VDYATDRRGQHTTVAFGELEAWTKALAVRISQVTEPGDRIALLAPQGIEYGAGFVAALRSHAVSVPLFAPDLLGQGDRLTAVVSDCSPVAVLTTRAKLELVGAFCAEHGIASEQIVVIDDYRTGHEQLARDYVFPSTLRLDDVAYLQYTSGSTRTPVGVCLTHRNLVENVLQLATALSRHGPDSGHRGSDRRRSAQRAA
jgi:fatty-acyl-CoA synthase